MGPQGRGGVLKGVGGWRAGMGLQGQGGFLAGVGWVACGQSNGRIWGQSVLKAVGFVAGGYGFAGVYIDEWLV